MKKSLLLLLPVMAFAAPAQAQDVDTRGGFRVEVLGLIDDIDVDLGKDDDQFNPTRDRDVDGTFGIGVGYDFVRGPGFGAGIDFEFSQSTSQQDIIVQGAAGGFPPAGDEVVGEVKFDNDLYVGGRVTAPIGGRFSVVGKLGYTSLKADVNFATGEDFDDDDNDFLDRGRLGGVRAGIGLHVNGTDEEESRTYYGVEYRYSDYEKGVKRNQLGLVAGVRF